GSSGRRLPTKPSTPSPRNRRPGNRPAFDVRQSLYRASGVDLTILEGIDDSTALVLLSELGIDMSPWPTVKQFVSWLGLCPQHRGSAGTSLSHPTASSWPALAKTSAYGFGTWALAKSYYGGARSAAGAMVASSGGDGFISLWSADTFRRLRRFAKPEDRSYASYSLAFSPDGKLLAAPGDHNTFVVWETATGQVYTRGGGHEAA